MHLETLAYMLAQEQRLSFESSVTADSNGHSSHVGNGSSRTDSSSGTDIQGFEQPSKCHGMSHGMSHANSNGNSNGNSYDGVDGLGPGKDNDKISNGHYSVTNGHSHIQRSSGYDKYPVSMVEIPAGDITLGVATDPSIIFVWDNEGPRQNPQHVSSFQMGPHPVSNEEFYKFAVEVNGYEEERYWQAEDLACLKKRKQSCPATWTVKV